jgi:phage recombination protein Bet
MKMNQNLIKFEENQVLKDYGWTKSELQIIKKIYCSGCSEEEIKVFSHVCRHTKLDPFLKQIYAIPRKGGMTIQTSIDGYRLIADRTGRYSPGRDSTYAYDEKGQLISATSYIKKMTPDGTWHEISATAYMKEYNPNQSVWRTMPHVMLAKCAEALALRKSFPNELSSIYTKEEMQQCDVIKNDNIKFTPIPELQDLRELFNQTTSEYKENFTKNLKTHFGIESFDEIPENLIVPLSRSMKININSKKEEIIEEVVLEEMIV